MLVALELIGQEGRPQFHRQATLDALGRMTQAWLPGRAKTATPSVKYGYGVNVAGVHWVPPEKLRANGTSAVPYSVSDSGCSSAGVS